MCYFKHTCLFANIYYAHSHTNNFDWNPIQEAQITKNTNGNVVDALISEEHFWRTQKCLLGTIH